MTIDFDETVGEKPGLEVFESYKDNGIPTVKRVEQPTFEKFQSDKSYAVVKTKDQESDKGKYSIHVWIGKDVDEESEKTAEEIGEGIYEKLEKKPTLYKDKEGNESDIFLEYFQVDRNSEDKRPEESEIIKKPQEEKQAKTCNCLSYSCLFFQPINFVLIFLTFAAMQKGIIYRHVPRFLRKELSVHSVAETTLHVLYDLVPGFLAGHLPPPAFSEKEYGIEFLMLIGLVLWTELFIINFINRLFTKNKRSCRSCASRNIVVFGGIIACIVAIDNGCVPKCMPVTGGLSFGVWLLNLLML